MCAEARANGPLRPTIGGITWAAAAVWLGVAASESIGAGLARDAALVRVGVACALCLFVAVLSRSRPTIALVAMGAMAGLCVGCAFWVRLDQAAARAAQRGSSSWRVEVVEDARVGTFGATSRCRVVAPPELAGQVEVAWPKSRTPPEMGAVANVLGTVSVPRDAARLRGNRREGVIGRLSARAVYEVEWTDGVRGLIARCRIAAVRRIDAIPGDGGAVLGSVVLGDRRRLADTLAEEDLRTAGLSHLATASGYHIALLVAAGTAVLVRMRVPVWARALTLGSALACFVLLTGGHAAVVRSTLVAVAGSVALLGGRRRDALSALSFVVAGLLVADPSCAFDIGFALSVAGVTGIVVFSRLAESWGRDAAPRALRLAIPMLAMTLCAQVATLPLSAATFGTVSLIAPVSNALCLPLSATCLLAGTVGLLASMARIPGGIWVARAASVSGEAMVRCASIFVTCLPNAALPLPTPSGAAWAAWAVAIAVLWVWWPRSDRERARWVTAAAGSVIVLVVIGPVRPGRAELVVLDVGQGDAILVRDGTHAALVDTGPPGAGLRRALGRHGIRRLDEVLLTHMHDDHAGGAPSLRGVVPVNDILIPPAADPDSDGFHASEALLGGREPRVVCAGESVAVGGVRLDIVYPPAAAATSENENETSLIILATYGGTRVLLTGDAEKDVLEPLVCSGAVGRVDVLKVGHHASRISLSEKMLTTMRPTWALISVGAGNRFGHPTPTALGLLRSAGVRVGRTDLEGDLTVAFDARGYRVTFGRHSAAVVAEGPTIGCQWLSPGSRCAKLVRRPVLCAPYPGDLESDGRLTCGPEARLPHIRQRGPPAGAGLGPASQ